MVPALPRPSSLLPEPAAGVAGLRPGGGGAARI